jgi:hypothetical protein
MQFASQEIDILDPQTEDLSLPQASACREDHRSGQEVGNRLGQAVDLSGV